MNSHTYNSTDTITAITTPMGEGGLGVIRVSGSQAITLSSQVFKKSGHSLLTVPSHTLHHGWIHNNGKMIDEVIAAVFHAPHSYTGEHIIEFSCHGSPVILKEILLLLIERGARQALPGEFTQRAYLNGKMDLMQAESVAELIHAKSFESAQVAFEHLRGNLSSRLKKIQTSLIDLLAHVEANLDFVEEDIPPLQKQEMIEKISQIKKEIETILATSVRGKVLLDGVKVVLAGEPNVGKSSLFNALLSRDRAIVTHIPGTTRDVLEDSVVWEGWPILLQDTAGLRNSIDQVEQEGQRRAKEAHNQADIILYVIDGSINVLNIDLVLKEFDSKKTIIVINKSDTFSNKKTFNIPSSYQQIQTSAKSGEGINDLMKACLNLLTKKIGVPAAEGIVLTQVRHIHHMEKINEHLGRSVINAGKNQTEEALSLDLRSALEELSQMTGESINEQVLDSIFRQFCIGK
ncbi:MAG: tRNA uridine-5-carboxymethylaminomethyl(34) synthesis GTPase MnmE [Elusimicrobiota bacterium]